jgi:hypothetical protein
MDAHVNVHSTFSAPTPNTFRIHHHITGEASNLGEEIACSLTAALLWPFIGAIMLDDDGADIPLSAYLAGLAATPLLRFFAILGFIETAGIEEDLQFGQTCVKQSDEHYECDNVLNLVVQLSSQFNTRLNLDAVSGAPEGLVLAGTVSNLGNVLAGSLTVDAKPFSYQIVGRCTGNGHNNFQEALQGEVDVTVTRGASVCSIAVVEGSDPAGEFGLAWDPVAGVATITPQVTHAYWDEGLDTYPCRVRVVTTRGVRVVTLAPPPYLTKEIGDELEAARERAVASCYVWKEAHTPKEQIHWTVDPAVLHALQMWQVVAHGLVAGESIQVLTADGSRVMTAKPTASGVADLRMLFPDDGPRTLDLELIGRGYSGVTREKSVQQLLYAPQSTIPVNGALREMRFEGGARRRQLIVADEATQSTWAMAAPMAPTLLSSVAASAGDRDTEAPVVLEGKRIGRPTEFEREMLSFAKLRQAGGEDRGQDGGGPPPVLAAPRVGGVRRTLGVREGDVWTLYDVSGTEPLGMQIFEMTPWFVGTAMGGDLLARHDPDAGVVRLYRAIARAVV